MKHFINMLFVILFITACGDSESKFNESDYIELSKNNKSKVSLANRDLEKYDLPSQLLKLGIRDNLSVPFDQDILYYRFYVNEEGDVNNIEVLHNEGKPLSVDASNIAIMKNWKFTLRENVNYKFDFVFLKNEIEEDVYSKIVAPEEINSLEKEFSDKVSRFPEIEGGVQKLVALIRYPKLAKESGVEGSVFVRAFINEVGEVKKVMVTRGIGSGCDIAAITAISKIKFIPAAVEGKPVQVQILIPIKFRLEKK